MRKYLIIFTIMVVYFTLLATTCDKPEDQLDKDDICSQRIMPDISRNFRVWAHFEYQDTVPYTGEVVFNIKKTYCRGTISGNYTLDHIPSNNMGDWFSGMTYNYDYRNKDDIVTISLIILNPLTGNSEIFSEYYNYAAVESQAAPPGAYEIHYNIVLPWNSPEETE